MKTIAAADMRFRNGSTASNSLPATISTSVSTSTGTRPVQNFDQRKADMPTGEVRTHMRVPVEIASPADGVGAAATKLSESGAGCLAVVSRRDIVGVVSDVDVMRAFVRARKEGTFSEEDDPSLFPGGDGLTPEGEQRLLEWLERERERAAGGAA